MGTKVPHTTPCCSAGTALAEGSCCLYGSPNVLLWHSPLQFWFNRFALLQPPAFSPVHVPRFVYPRAPCIDSRYLVECVTHNSRRTPCSEFRVQPCPDVLVLNHAESACVLHRQGRARRPRHGPNGQCIEQSSPKRQHKPTEGRSKPQEARRNRQLILSEGIGPTI